MLDDWRAERCGHNFRITACTAKQCDARDAVAQLARAEEVIVAARALTAQTRYVVGLPDGDPYKGTGNRLADALAEYDRPSTPLDGRDQ